MSGKKQTIKAPQPTEGWVEAQAAVLCKKDNEVTGILLTTQTRIKAEFEVVDGKVFFKPFASLDEQFKKDETARCAFFGRKEMGNETFEAFMKSVQYLL
jgi:hypothetical protein